MIGVQFEFCSAYRCLLGIFFQKGTERINDELLEFTEVSLGLIFIYIRIAKYQKKEN
jgi:hypothetical protein